MADTIDPAAGAHIPDVGCRTGSPAAGLEVRSGGCLWD
jgi:hypothetical protein